MGWKPAFTRTFAACAIAASVSAAFAAPMPPAWHLSSSGYGPARIGMSPQQVINLLGLRSLSTFGTFSATCLRMQDWSQKSLQFTFAHDHLLRIAVSSQQDIEAKHGIHIGSSERDVRQAYGPALVAESLPAPRSKALTAWTPDHQRGIRFEIDADGRVSSIAAGTALIAYGEECP
jgi:hypothetical protein